MRLAVWVVLFFALTLFPVLEVVLGASWWVGVVNALIVAGALWMVVRAVKGDQRDLSPRAWGGANVRTLGGVLLVVAVLWDPFGWLPFFASLLAGGGLLESFLVRASMGVGVYLGADFAVMSLRPTETQVVRAEGKMARKREKKARRDEALDL